MTIRFSTTCAVAVLALAPLSAQVDAPPAPAGATEQAPAAPKLVTLDHSTPDGMLNSLKGHMMHGQVAAMWAGVAPAHRTEVHGMLMQVVKNVEPSVYDAVTGLVGRLGPILEDQRPVPRQAPDAGER